MGDKRPGSKRSREILALILLSLAVFLLMALISYDPRDPSLSHVLTDDRASHNLVGKVGSYSADLMILLFGIGSFLLPCFLIFTALRLFRDESFVFSGSYLAGFAGIIISSCSLIGLHVREITYQDKAIPTGGLVGYFLVPFLDSYFKLTGTYIILFVVLIIALIFLADLSLVTTWEYFSRSIRAFFGSSLASWKSFFKGTIQDKPLERRKREDKGPPALVLAEEPPVSGPPSPAGPPAAKGAPSGRFNLPSLGLLDDSDQKDVKIKRDNLLANSKTLEKKLENFGVEGKIVEIRPGPVITMYELEPAPGIKINRITNLSDDMALALKAQSVRIIAPIPGKAVIGLEIPNSDREAVRLRDVLKSEAFQGTSFRLPVALGVDIVGTPVVADLVKMPHLLIAGTTGSGKSVALNAMVCSILFKARPDEAKLLMIDPKRLELSLYEGIPHLLHPVVVDPKKAAQALKWAVGEMERRYKIISEVGAKGIEQYNQLVDLYVKGKTALPKGKPIQETLDDLWEKTGQEEGEAAVRDSGGKSERNPLARLPYIVIVIDEMADLMMVAQRHVEESLARLAQMSRAAGIHLILATQRPSVDVITGVIKANFPTRISFQVSSKVDSRTILDQPGAEKLLGAGDMLFIPPGTSRLTRIHGVYVSDKEIERIVGFIKSQAKPLYDQSISEFDKEAPETDKPPEEYDEKYDEAVELVTELGQASISLVQRYLKIGYNRAARIIEKMETEGVVGPADGVKPRKVLARRISK